MNYDIDKDFKILSKLIFLNQSVFLNNIYIVHKTIKIYYWLIWFHMIIINYNKYKHSKSKKVPYNLFLLFY